MANKSIQVYPTDEVLERVNQQVDILKVVFNRVSESGAVNSLIAQLVRLEAENMELKSELRLNSIMKSGGK